MLFLSDKDFFLTLSISTFYEKIVSKGYGKAWEAKEMELYGSVHPMHIITLTMQVKST